MLRSIGISFRKLARKTGGIACRERGDTFLLYCPHRDDYEQLLKKFMKDLYVEEDTSEKVELRFGVFVNAEQETEIEDRFACAKIAANNIIDTAELKEHFGTSGQGCKAVTARCSALYDIQNDIVLDAVLDKFSVGERSQAMKLLEKRHIFKGVKELIIFDRGYYSSDFMEELLAHGYEFVFRMPTKRLEQADSLPNGIHTVKVTLKDGKRARVRIVKFNLNSGETETLLTNFYKQHMTVEDYKKLYFMRWHVETKFDIVKNKIQLENFTGRTVEAISQDFYTCMYLTNMVAIFKAEADWKIREQRKDKNNKYEYQANTNEIVGSFKDRFILACLEPSPSRSKKLIDQIFSEIKRSVVPIRPDRTLPRPQSVRRMKHYHNQKCNA